MVIYDIFGFTTQTLQGADIIGNSDLAPLIVVPDMFNGTPINPEWIANKTEANRQHVKDFISLHACPDPALEKIRSNDGIFCALQVQYPDVTAWGAMGFCWGGKIVTLAAGTGTPFSAVVQTSPARLDAADAAKVKIPMAVLASKDEDASVVVAFGNALHGEKHIETWADSAHGFMSAK